MKMAHSIFRSVSVRATRVVRRVGAHRKSSGADRRSIPKHGIRLLAVWLVAGSATLVAAAPVKSIAEFVALKPRWRQYAEVKTSFRLEGRHSTLAPTQLRFRKCDLNFVAKTGSRFPKRIGKSQCIEVQGNMAFVRGKMVFVVEQLTVLSGDEDRIQQQLRRMLSSDYQKMYSLGRWTARRAEFYSDKQLADLAVTIVRQGVKSERRRLKRNDAAQLYKLAERIQGFNLGDDLRLEVVHEALWVERRNGHPLLALSKAIAKRLAGADRQLRPPQPKLQTRYLRDPISVYAMSPLEERKKLHRILFYDVQREMVESQAKADRSNGKEIAQELDARVPELHALAEEYRDGELNYRFQRIALAGRNEMLELSEEYRQRKQLQKSQEVMRTWILSWEPEWRKAGPAGLIRLADEYLQLLEDRPTAVTLLKQAYDQTKGAAEVEQKLNELGWYRQGKQWKNTPGKSSTPGSESAGNSQPGVPLVGMTRQQVIAAWGQPAARVRIVTDGEINEIWNYGNATSPGTSIQFVHRLNQIPSLAIVSRISDAVAP